MAIRWGQREGGLKRSETRNHFDRALDVFFDPLHELLEASVDEERRVAAVYVVHLDLEREAIRVISARLADPSERRDHEELE